MSRTHQAITWVRSLAKKNSRKSLVSNHYSTHRSKLHKSWHRYFDLRPGLLPSHGQLKEFGRIPRINELLLPSIVVVYPIEFTLTSPGLWLIVSDRCQHWGSADDGIESIWERHLLGVYSFYDRRPQFFSFLWGAVTQAGAKLGLIEAIYQYCVARWRLNWCFSVKSYSKSCFPS